MHLAEDPAAKVHETLSGPHWMFYAFLIIVIALDGLIVFTLAMALRMGPLDLLNPNAIIYMGFGVVLLGIVVGWWWLLFRLEPAVVSFVGQFGSRVLDGHYVRGGYEEGLYLDFDGNLHLRATPRTLIFWRFFHGSKDPDPSAFAAGDSLLQGNFPGQARVCRVQRRFRPGTQTGLGLVGERFGARVRSAELIGNPLRPGAPWEVQVVYRATGWRRRGPEVRNALTDLASALETEGLAMQTDALNARSPAPR